MFSEACRTLFPLFGGGWKVDLLNMERPKVEKNRGES